MRTRHGGEGEPSFFVTSSDGTRIACFTSGSGSPLVLLHGTSGDHTSFRFVEPLLARHFTLHAVERRGRGASGDAEAYTIEQEFEDAAAVVEALGEPVDVFGHSFGATVALGAVPLSPGLRRLVLYEPAPGIASVSPELLEDLEHLLSRGERERLLDAVMIELAGFGPEELEAFRASPSWAPRVAAAHTLPREVRAEEQCALDPKRYADLRVRTLLLLGGESPAWAKQGTDRARSLLLESSLVVLEGQGHVATLTAPELVAGEILRFLGPSPAG